MALANVSPLEDGANDSSSRLEIDTEVSAHVVFDHLCACHGTEDVCLCVLSQLPGYIHTQIAGEKHDDGHEIVMIPGIDMMNHGSGGDPGTATFEIKDGKATVTTGSGGLKRGEEVLVSYGDKICGVKPLNLYGFVWEACEGEPNHGGDPQPEEPAAQAADELPPIEGEGKKDL